MAKFMAHAGLGEAPGHQAGAPRWEPSPEQLATMRAATEMFLAHLLRPTTHYRPDVEALRAAPARRLLLRFHLYQFDPAADFEGAARIYRRCRQAGITPRGLVDCLIAAVARRHEATLLACDIDLDRVARVIGVELDRPATPERPQPCAMTARTQGLRSPVTGPRPLRPR